MAARVSPLSSEEPRSSFLSTDSTLVSCRPSVDAHTAIMSDKLAPAAAADCFAHKQSRSTVCSGQAGSPRPSLEPDEDQTIQNVRVSLRRLENHRLQDQRYDLTEDQVLKMHSAALGARIENSLKYRMVNQDAERSRPVSDGQKAPRPAVEPAKKTAAFSPRSIFPRRNSHGRFSNLFGGKAPAGPKAATPSGVC